MLSATVLLFLSALHASTLLLTEARHSVSHVTTFVSDLAVSERFYIDVLQGVKESTLSTEDWVNSTYTNSVPALDLEPHDQLRWSFVVYKNLMVQLVEIKSAKLDSEEKTTAARSPLDMMSSMMKGTALAFWLDDEVNVTEYMMYLEEKAHNLRVEGFSLRRPFLLSDTATTRQANEGITELRDASLTGLSIVYGTGPDGEIIKFIQLNNQSRHSFGRHYCEQNVVSVGYLERDDGKKSAQPACLCGDGEVKSADEVKFGTMYGVNHISMSTMNINQSVADFTELLGGHLIDDVQPSNMESDSLTQILTCDMPSPTGSENIMAAKMKKMMSTIRLNLRYILLDNVKIELSFITFGN